MRAMRAPGGPATAARSNEGKGGDCRAHTGQNQPPTIQFPLESASWLILQQRLDQSGVALLLRQAATAIAALDAGNASAADIPFYEGKIAVGSFFAIQPLIDVCQSAANALPFS